MSTDYHEIKASSISDAFAKSLRFIEGWAYKPTYVWFRGVKNQNHTLQPGASWRSGYDESQALVDFISRGVAFGDVGGIDDWSTYYLAQHHGMPTRLLDWTESFTSALFFAFDGWDGTTTPAIWLFQPCLLNETFIDWYGILGPEGIAEMSIYLPRMVNEPKVIKKADKDGYIYNNNWPMAIYPKWTNHRIAAQQGMFTIHGRDSRSLPELVKAARKDPRDHFARISLAGFDPDTIYTEMSMLGIRRSAIYPDMDNFVKELKDLQGW